MAVFTTNCHCECVLETERIEPFEMPLCVALPHCGENLFWVLERFFLEHRGERRSGVFGINVDVSGDHGLLCQERAAEPQSATHVSVEAVFEVLGDDFSQDELLAEVLGSYA